MARLSIRSMIVEDLGYCCPWFFFSRFRRTALIAARLGVTPQAVRACRSTCGGCEGKPECLDKRITLTRTLRRQRDAT
jgi:hypothetical protein